LTNTLKSQQIYNITVMKYNKISQEVTNISDIFKKSELIVAVESVDSVQNGDL